MHPCDKTCFSSLGEYALKQTLRCFCDPYKSLSKLRIKAYLKAPSAPEINTGVCCYIACKGQCCTTKQASLKYTDTLIHKFISKHLSR